MPEKYSPYDNRRRKLWTDKGYRENMASAAVASPPEDDDYRRLYHLLPKDFGISNIALGRIKIATFHELNDPFEVSAASITTYQSLQQIMDFKANVAKEVGLICFSSDWADPVLWSHYAEKHTGMCLGFDVKQRPSIALKEVEYIKDKLPFDPDDEISKDEMLSRFITTKFKSWEYEKEVRLLMNLRKCYSEGEIFFEPFSSTLALKEVILGPNCSLDVTQIRNLVAQRFSNVLVYKSRLANKSFDIVPHEASLPDS